MEWTLIIIIFVTAQVAAVAIPYAAWKGHPSNFSRESFFMAFVATGALAGVLLTVAQHVYPTGLLLFIVKGFCGDMAILGMGVSVGCMISILTYCSRDAKRRD